MQLGHGGATADGTYVGDIFATATVGKVEFLGGTDTILTTTGDRPGADGDGLPNGSYAQLGHGGYSATGAHSGNITVNAGSNAGVGLNFVGGNTTNAYVQLGHGGAYSKGVGTSVGTAQGFVGNITVNSVGSINFTAGSNLSGATDEDARLYAQLGHGGYDSDAANTNTNFFSGTNWGHTGDIIVNSVEGDITFTGGNRAGASSGSEGRFHYSQLGHGGYAAGGNPNGSITVEATAGDINFHSGGGTVDDSTSLFNYAQLGHGGAEDQGNLGKTGDVTSVTAGGAINFDSDSTATGYNYNYVQLGNGGYNFDGSHTSEIVVIAGDGGIDFTAGPGVVSYAHLGNGGYAVGGDHSGAITVTSGLAGIKFRGGAQSSGYAQIGNGGRSASGNHSSAINVSTTGLVDFMAGSGDYSYARIGHGGDYAAGDKSGSISVTGDGVTFLGGGGYFASAQIGHGGRDSAGNADGSITVDAGSGQLNFTGGGWDGTGSEG